MSDTPQTSARTLRDVYCAYCGCWMGHHGLSIEGPARCWQCAQKLAVDAGASVSIEQAKEGHGAELAAVGNDTGSSLTETASDISISTLQRKYRLNAANAMMLQNHFHELRLVACRSARQELVAYFRDRHQSLTAREIEEAIVELESR